MNKNKTKALLMCREEEHLNLGISISVKTKSLEKYFEKRKQNRWRKPSRKTGNIKYTESKLLSKVKVNET